jgi:uncharacterized protein
VNGTIPLDVGGTRLLCLPERAVWLEQARLLLVADLHLGKAVSFRRQGVPVPQGTTSDNLQRLSALIKAWQPTGIVFLGDFLHGPDAHAPATLDALARWREAHAQISLSVVRGNHDLRAGDPPAWLGASCVDEGLRVEGTTLALCHHPDRIEGAYALAGHLHPCVVLSQGFERLRMPCFHARPEGLVLPAFGAFTGMHPIRRVEGDRVWAVSPGRLMALP